MADRVDPAGLTATRRGVASANAKLPLRGDRLYPFLEEFSGLRSPSSCRPLARCSRKSALPFRLRPKGFWFPIFRSEAGAA